MPRSARRQPRPAPAKRSWTGEAPPRRPGERSVDVGEEGQSVPEVLGPGEGLGHGCAWVRPCGDEAEREMRVDLPIRVPIQLGGDVAGRDRPADRVGPGGRVVQHVTVQYEPPSEA